MKIKSLNQHARMGEMPDIIQVLLEHLHHNIAQHILDEDP